MNGTWIRIFALLIFVGALAVGGGWWMLRGQGGTAPPPPKSAETVTAEPVKEDAKPRAHLQTSDSATYPSVIEPFEAIPISAKLTANIAGLQVRDGSVVRKGQLLCILEDTEIRKQIDAARLIYVQAQEMLRRASESRDIQAKIKQIALARAKEDLESAQQQNLLELQRAEDALRRAERNLAQYEPLLRARLVPAIEVRNKEDVVEDARRQLELMKFSQVVGIAVRQKALQQAQLDVQNETISLQDIEAYKMAVANAQLELRERQERLADTRVLAPIGGTVRIIARTRTSSMTATGQSAEVLGPGVRVYEGDPFLEIATTERACCHIEVDETDISRLHIGTKAKITGDAFAGRELDGEVAVIQTSGRKAGEGVSLFPITVLITSPLQGVRMGMTADVAIKLSE